MKICRYLHNSGTVKSTAIDMPIVQGQKRKTFQSLVYYTRQVTSQDERKQGSSSGSAT